MEGLDLLFHDQGFDLEIDLVVADRDLLDPFQYFQALVIKALIIQDPGKIKLLMEKDIDILTAFEQPEAAEYLPVQVRLYVGNLLLFNGGGLTDQHTFIIYGHFIDRIKYLHHLQIIIG
jgi:hypothetical protein